jgi:pSer/pThr/pTyr-binding forkhead associated (FHA) protein
MFLAPDAALPPHRGVGEFTLLTLPPLTASLRLEGRADQPIVVKQPRARIGRQGDNDIVLDDASVSRYHAIVTRDADGFWIEDTGSKRGVFVDGERVEEQVPLAPGASIRIGDVVMRFSVGYDERSQAAAQG